VVVLRVSDIEDGHWMQKEKPRFEAIPNWRKLPWQTGTTLKKCPNTKGYANPHRFG
jgi:hypothetical protein